MNYAVNQGNTLQEINFWISKEKSLNMIEQQLKLPEVDLTLQLLSKKQIFVVNQFKYDCNFKTQLKIC